METDILEARTFPENLHEVDWETLRSLSLRPGGFKEQRINLWAQLLNVDPALRNIVSDDTELINPVIDGRHASVSSEDIDPHEDERQVRLDTDRSFVLYPVDDMKERERRQNDLHDLIVGVFRKRRRLNYFQGYHDIISVLFLTLPKELQFLCAEKLSLHRVRDSMGSGLEPVVGLLRIMKRLMILADAEYAALLEQNAPLPYYALSNLLTLFSHDMPTLPLIQHVFDYLLCRPPISVVYLATAVVLARKQEVEILQQEGEEGMIHSLLSSLPDLYDDEEQVAAQKESVFEEKVAPEPENSSGPSPDPHSSDLSLVNSVLASASNLTRSETHLPGMNLEDSTKRDPAPHLDDSPAAEGLAATPELAQSDSETPHNLSESSSHVLQPSDATSQSFETAAEKPETAISQASSTKSHSRKSSFSSMSVGVPRPRVSLSSLLKTADELYSLYPPMHSAIALPAIMGPQSVMLTWSENPADLPSDDEAELMVTQPQLIVIPFVEDTDTKEDEEEDEPEKTRKHRRRRLRKPRRIGSVVIDRRTVVTSAVLVLGVAMAVYGLQAPERRNGGAKTFGKMVGGLLVGAGEKLWEHLVGMHG
ncbi:hypothetical protein PHLCEN_2v8331 [Hermanssonia centrifuga]|uniref:Rab-GAP TBC domain-containing protein n=1 Tax=Hermanssonia centrifuga TaxID=98765 RepID=A0A2R6NTV1_9APHY|nr:hypothetical protein PHLCEN_2v8331 [Hermanssonia centrifuga]